jgi:hypothetical protein
MDRFFLLTNRKRAIVALVHTVAFLGIAAATAALTVRPLGAASPRSAWALAAIYFAVSAILAVLCGLSPDLRERLYFGLCAASAAAGFARQVVGDPRLHAAVYARPAMLAGAIAMGLVIVRAHARQSSDDERGAVKRPA